MADRSTPIKALRNLVEAMSRHGKDANWYGHVRTAMEEARAVLDEQAPCEMMLGWAGYTPAQIAKRIKKGLCCDCDAHNGGVCKQTGHAYFSKPQEKPDE